MTMMLMTATTTAAKEPGSIEKYILPGFGVGFLLLMGALCVLLLTKMWRNEINLATLLDEANGDASMSRFQLLLFSIVVSVGLFLYMLKNQALPDVPDSILILVGISASTYAASKGISYSQPQLMVKPAPNANVAPTLTAAQAAAEAAAEGATPVVAAPVVAAVPPVAPADGE